MKVVKSPVLYFGIALVLAVGMALLAPYIVDWGRYRADLETWAQKLTGRQVAIRGDIAVKLFPFPQLSADDVVIANPDGFREPVFASLERVRVQVTLGGLVNGELQVESIEIENPVASLVRMEGNRVNWAFAPAVSHRTTALLEKVRLDKIAITGGTIHVIDEVHGRRGKAEALGATLSAPSLVGPWRSAGSMRLNGQPLSYSLSTAAWDAARPFRFALRLTPSEQAGYSATIDGEKAAGADLKGQVQIAPVADAEGKSNSEGQFRDVTAKAGFTASLDRLSLDDIEIRPADANDQGTLITAKASASIGERIAAQLEVSAPRVDLDALAGAGSRQLLRDGGGLALINGLFASLPKELELAAKVKVQALRAGGEILEKTELQFATSADAVRVEQISASLPGRSRLLFSGVFFPGERFAELGGTLSLESLDTRQLAVWLAPEVKDQIARVWTGNRGRLKAQSEVRLTASKLEFRGVQYELDGDRGEARLAMLVNGERPILDAELKTKRLDIDAYLPHGIGSFSADGMRWTWLFGNFLNAQSRRDMSLALQAEQLLLNGVDAREVKADIETTVRGVDIKGLSIASVGGARFTAAGVMLNTDAGTDGDIRMRVTAEDPRGLMRLAGIMPRDREPAWTRPLGHTDVDIVLEARPGRHDGGFGLTVAGSSGPLTIKADGALSEVTSDKVKVKLAGRVDSRNSAELWRLLGGTPRGDAGAAANATLQLDGFLNGEMQVSAAANLHAAALSYAGTVSTGQGALAGAGQAAVESEDISAFVRSIGIPTAAGPLPAVSAQARLQFAPGEASLTDIAGRSAGGAISGTLSLKGSKLSGDVSVERMSLAQALAAAFLPWDGAAASSETLIAAGPPAGIEGELWVRPRLLDVYPGYTVPDGQIGVTARAGSTHFVVYGKDQTGQKVSLELKLDSSLAQRKLDISATMPFRLESLLEGADGSRPFAGVAAVDVKLKGQGLSPAAVVADLAGEGAFQVVGGSIGGISPEQFTSSIGKVNDAESLQASLGSMQKGAGLSFSPLFGSVDIRQGVGRVTPFDLSTPDANVTVSPIVDLVQGLVRIPVTLDLKALPNLPRMTVTYEGSPQSLARREDTGALSAHLGFKVLERGVDELEKVQAEQARLAREEEEMRKQDQQRLEQFYAQRAELRLRQRELRTFAAQRLIDKQREDERRAALIAAGRQINRDELARRARELSVFGRPLGGTAPAPVTPRSKPAPPPDAPGAG